MHALLALLLVLAAPAGHAVRTLPVETYATLVRASVAQRDGQLCTAAAGSTVLLVAQVTDTGRPQAGTRLFVRVVDGACTGYALTVDEQDLRDQRAAPPASTPVR